MCGEQIHQQKMIMTREGSPPRVRGTGPFRQFSGHKIRITPACAGNRSHARPFFYVNRDHPRVCGEQYHKVHVGWCGQGSPPRVRGTVGALAGDLQAQGITPACAGNRDAADQPQRGQQDHPRVCGEQKILLHRQHLLLGSPPRVRGTATLPSMVRKFQRITPACAGNRLFFPC